MPTPKSYRITWVIPVAIVAVFLLVAGVGCALSTQPDAEEQVTPATATTTTERSSSLTTESTTASTTTTTTTTTKPSPSTGPPAPGALDAVVLLAAIPVAKEHPGDYERDLFPMWLDVDGDGCRSRDQVLIRDSLTRAHVDPVGCHVITGDWTSPYDGARWESPGDVDIDHVVALKEVWDSGGWRWDAARRTAYANDTSDDRTLVTVTDSVNQAKGDKDPSNWLPPRHSDECRYVAAWISIKTRWALSMDQSEAGRLRNLIRRDCRGLEIDPWKPVPLSPGTPHT